LACKFASGSRRRDAFEPALSRTKASASWADHLRISRKWSPEGLRTRAASRRLSPRHPRESPRKGADACTAFAAPGGGGGRADEASGEVRREGAAEAAGARRLSVVG